MKSHGMRTLGVVVLLAGLVLPAAAQTLQLYGLPHLFALPNASTTRNMGMGGFWTCVEDIGFANPAFAGTVKSPQALLRYSTTDFVDGPTLKGFQGAVSWPSVPDLEGFQVTYFDLDSDRAATRIGGTLMDMQEQDLAVHYGRRLDENWVVGLGVSPMFNTQSNIYEPTLGLQMAHLSSTPQLGFRLGGLYQLPQEGWIGLIAGYYEEEANGDFPLAVPPFSMTESFYSTEYAIGASQLLMPNLRGAIEYFDTTTRGMGMTQSVKGWRAGVEWTPSAGWALRAGVNDGAYSVGAGVELGNWSLQYAYLDDWNAGTVEDFFGESSTHQFEVRCHW